MRTVTLIIAIAVLVALPAAAQFPINTTFMDSNWGGWNYGAYAGSNFTPCLTSGNASCGNDPAGQGWLRLTNSTAASNGEAGYAYYPVGFSPGSGFAVDFEYVSWGGTGADGIGVILFNALATFSVGAPGGSFGYAADYNAATSCNYAGDTTNGLSGAYLGFALDEFGNFENSADRCKNGGSGTVAVPESISLRGEGPLVGGDNSGTNYIYIAGTGRLNPKIDSAGGTTRPPNTTYYRHVIIDVVPNTSTTPPSVTYTVTWMTSLYGSFSTVLGPSTYTFPTGYVTPANLMLAFTASTGGSTNYHEIRNVKVSYPADLAVTKTHSGTPGSGGTTTYTMVVTNNGPAGATGASFSDPLPTGVTLTGNWTCSVAGTGSCSPASGSTNPINITLNLNSGAVATITAPVKLPVGTPQQVINTATVLPPGGVTDPNPNNNSATDVIDIGAQSTTVTITKAASTLMLQGGGSEYFAINVANSGTSAATAVTVTDTLTNPPFASVGSVSATQGSCSVVGLAVTCNLGVLPAKGSATIIIPATVIATPGTHNAYTNRATVAWTEDGGTPVNSNTVTLSTLTTVPAAQQTDFAITQTHSPSSPSAGGPVTYTIVVTNNGSATVTAASFSDVVPPSVTVSGWSCAPASACTPPNGLTNSVTTSITLAAGASVTITVTGTIVSGTTAPIVNTATITPPGGSGGYYDTNGANNTAIDEISFAPLPVTVARFLAVTESDGVRFQWTSAIEVSNAGYNLYAQSEHGLVRLNERLIASRSPDSTIPVRYEEFVAGAPPGPYVLEDVDILTGARRHGPFDANREYGVEPVVEPIDWAAVRAATREVSALTVTQAAAVQQVNLLVGQDGLYRVTYESLKAAGFDLAGIPVQQLALTCRGVSVPLLVLGPGAAIGDSPARNFGPGVAVEFLGTAVNSLYTHTNVYTFGKNARAATRVVLDATPAPAGNPPPYYMETATVTKPLQYSFASPTGTPWYETGILAYTTPVEQTFTVPIDNLVDGAGGGHFYFHMWGGTDWPDASPDHHVVLALNGQTVANDFFDGVTDYPVAGSLPTGVLSEGANTYTLTLPGDTGVAYEMVNVSSYGLTYPRLFVARNGVLSFASNGGVQAVDGLPSANTIVYRLGGAVPRRLTQVQDQPSALGFSARFAGTSNAGSYLVCDVGSVQTPAFAAVSQPAALTNGLVDYLIIAHPSFISGLGPLVNARTAQGLRVKVANVNDVYAAFGYGIVDPQAIHDYIAYAYKSMQARYVLLVGGDTYDYFDYLQTGSISFVPTPYAATSDLIRFAPADPLLADVNGNGVPDLAIGRLPVRTPAELATVIAKTLAYPGHGTGAVFSADATDGTYSFTAVSDQLAAFLPAKWAVTRAYMDTLGLAGASSTLIGAINSGAAFTSFVGHSSFTQWSFSDLFDTTDAVALLNAGHPTVVTQWGCWNTYYVDPYADTLGHKLLLAGPQGAAAVMGSATLSEADSQAGLGRLLLPLLFKGGVPLGTALTQAKQQLAVTQPQALDVLRGWTLLGDPALVIVPAHTANSQALAIGTNGE